MELREKGGTTCTAQVMLRKNTPKTPDMFSGLDDSNSVPASLLAAVLERAAQAGREVHAVAVGRDKRPLAKEW